MLALSSFTPIILMGKGQGVKFGTLLIKAKDSLRLKNA